MKNKKITIIIILIFLLIIFLPIYIINNLDKPKAPINNTETNKIIDNKTYLDDDKKTLNVDNTTSTTTTKPTTTTITKKTTKPTTSKTTIKVTQTTKPTYKCPDGFTLNGTTCTRTINASASCPENMHATTTENGEYCINLSEGYDTEEDSCPNGYVSIAVISLGAPTKYHCHPLHEKIYTCPEDYNLNNKKCNKTVDATIK